MKTHVMICSCVTIAALWWVFICGQDVNWDLQNYHEYDPFALLHWRYGRDVAPAGPQSFLNPLPYLLPYGFHQIFPALAAGLAIGVSQLPAFLLTYFIAFSLCKRGGISCIAVMVAASGPVTLIELGTTFSDLVLAIPPLISILCLLRSPSTSNHSSRKTILAAAIVTGIAIGAKPTGIFSLPALGALVLIQQSSLHKAGLAAMIVIAGTVTGALLSDGLWAWFLWRNFESPIFPFLNTVFQSPDAALVDFSDPRYRFSGWMHALKVVYGLAFGSDETGELPIRDGRLAVATSLVIVRLASLLTPNRWRQRDGLDAVSVYFLVGLAGWLVICPIERYAAILEMIAGLLSVLIIARLSGRVIPTMMLIVIPSILVLTTRSADYFHRPWSDTYAPHVPAGIPSGSAYGLIAQPLAYWVATYPYPTQAFNLFSSLTDAGGKLEQQISDIIKENRDQLWLLNLDQTVDPGIRKEMARHGLILAPPCVRGPSMISLDTVFCRGVGDRSRRMAASDLAMGDTIEFSKSGSGLIFEVTGFYPTDDDGTWAAGDEAELAMDIGNSLKVSPSVLLIRMAGVPNAGFHRVSIAADGRQTQEIQIAPASDIEIVRVCIPAQPQGDGIALIHFHTAGVRSQAELGLGADPRRFAFRLINMRLQPANGSECD